MSTSKISRNLNNDLFLGSGLHQTEKNSIENPEDQQLEFSIILPKKTKGVKTRQKLKQVVDKINEDFKYSQDGPIFKS